MYWYEAGVLRDEKKGGELLEGASGFGSAQGQFWFAKALAGAGHVRSAIHWYEEAAASGFSVAYYRPGCSYEFGVEIDLGKAFRYDEKGASLGHFFAKRNLSRLLVFFERRRIREANRENRYVLRGSD